MGSETAAFLFLPTNALLCVAARLVVYAIARKVKITPITTVVIRVPSAVPLLPWSGLHDACLWFPTADMMRYVQ